MDGRSKTIAILELIMAACVIGIIIAVVIVLPLLLIFTRTR